MNEQDNPATLLGLYFVLIVNSDLIFLTSTPPPRQTYTKCLVMRALTTVLFPRKMSSLKDSF